MVGRIDFNHFYPCFQVLPSVCWKYWFSLGFWRSSHLCVGRCSWVFGDSGFSSLEVASIGFDWLLGCSHSLGQEYYSSCHFFEVLFWRFCPRFLSLLSLECNANKMKSFSYEPRYTHFFLGISKGQLKGKNY